MRRFVLALALVASIAVAAVAQGTQTPVRDPQTTRAATATTSGPSGRASIAGVVSSADSSAQPIRLAMVVLIGEKTGALDVTMTDASGAFAFHDLPADHYLVGASKRPYIGAVAGATRPARPGVPVVVADGQTISNVAIKLTPGAAISGAVVDERGHPALAVIVLVKQWRMRGGERTLATVPNGGAVTDDRGLYRIFGLAPGQYIVSAQAPTAPAGVSLRDADVDRALAGGPIPPTIAPPAREYAPVFAPGSTQSQSDAMTIDLAPGDDRQGVDMQLAWTRLVTLEGSVASADGQPITMGRLMTLGDDGSSKAAAIRPDGHFTLRLRSGTQFVQVLGPNNPLGFASIDVGDTDQSGIQITLRPGLTLTGRLTFDGATAPPSIAGRAIPLHAVSAQAETAHRTPLVQTSQTGAFAVNNLMPGQYVVSGPMAFGATADSMKWTIGSVVAGGKDVTDLPIALTADAAPADVVVTMTDIWQSVSGRIEGAPANAAYTVVIFPADRQYWMAGSRRVRTTRAGSDGAFTIGGPGSSSLPAGSYLLAVVTDIDTGEEFDPAFLDAILGAATPVAVARGARVIQNVRVR
jgi:hypothetical protein